MIRFSAALVAVAIGVLIGGIATSKLLLVYIAIVVSAVALVALAIGVVVKREELFREDQGLGPAGADAAPVLSAHAGESQDQHRVAADQHRVAADQQSPSVSVPPSASFPGPTAGHGAALGGTAFVGSAFGETAQVAPPAGAPPRSAANPPAPHQAADGRSRAGDPVPPWETASARDQWSSSPWPGSTATDPAPDWVPSGRGDAGPARTTAPSPSPAGPPARSSAGPEPASPNWFAPKTRPADATPPVTEAPAEAPADASAADDDADWPTRYSWLDDEADETAGDETDETDAPADQATKEDADGATPASGFPDPEGEAAATSDAPVPAATGAESAPEPADPGPASAEPEPEAVSADSEPAFTDTQDLTAGDDLVTVLPGVPRYHQPDCVLIRFMPDDDIQRLPVAQAKADGCTPCAACQPAS